jgi:predicted nucleic acid-binding Zn ribbon protein
MRDRDEEDDWDRDAATPKQLTFLRRLGVSHAKGISMDEASDLITECLARRDRKKRNTLLGGILIVLVAILIVLALSQTK